MQAVLDQHKVVVCVGSGGVGKTTTSAALALHAAMQGKRVLCLTIDPARRLANSLGLSQMQTSEQHIEPALFAQHGLACEGSLAAMMLDTKRTFDELVERHASSPEARDRILKNQIYQYVSTSLAGTQEYMAMEKLHAVRQAGNWDLIVLDTPPTGNALDFLDAPEKLTELVDSPTVRWFIEAFQNTGKMSFSILGNAASLVLKGLAKFTGAEFLAKVAEFVTGLNDLFGGFKARAGEVAKALRSRDVAFILVTSTSPMAMDEALFFHRRLSSVGMRTHGVVVNGVRAIVPEPAGSDEALQRDVAAKLAADGQSDAVDPESLFLAMQQALDDERVRSVADRVQTEWLRTQTAGTVPLFEVPAFEQDVHDLSALAKVAEHLLREEG